MKKGISIILPVAIFAILFFAQTASAYSSNTGFFGGKIISDKALKIEYKEWSNYTCFVPGTSISIAPIGSNPSTPTDYFIPFSTSSKTGNTSMAGEYILGAYMGETPISCMLNVTPYTIDTVYLPTIYLFGTSGGVSTKLPA